jgi:predicted nucleic acid-binding Zn ribbon protein
VLEIAQDGPCAGHPCDRCRRCMGSVPKRLRKSRPGVDPRCCRLDNPHYRLPAEGDWDGPVYGTLGVLERDDDGVECHACGERFRRMSAHVWQAHYLTGREYRAVFGLKLTESLDCDDLRERNRLGHLFLSDPNDPRMQRMEEIRQQHVFTPERAQYARQQQRISRQERNERISSGRFGIIPGLRKPPSPCQVCRAPVTRTSGRDRKTCSEACRKVLTYGRSKDRVWRD